MLAMAANTRVIHLLVNLLVLFLCLLLCEQKIDLKSVQDRSLNKVFC